MCQSFRDNAREVQRDLDDALRLGISRNEVTITEDILLNLARAHSPRSLKIKTYTQHEEAQNGADWEFWFCNSKGLGIAVRVQAKKLSRSGKYESLFYKKDAHKQNGSSQCEELINKSGASIPIYVFYNGLNNFSIPLKWLKLQHYPFCAQITDWGISMCSAYSVKDAMRNNGKRPKDIGNMLPWHRLVCACCCANFPSNFDLPSFVGNSLQSLFMDGDREEDRRLSFEPTTDRPRWVGQLNEVAFGGEEFLDGMMLKAELGGIAIIEQIDLEG